MSDAEFIAKFIADSVKSGKNAKEFAKFKIQKIDEVLNESEKLKIRRMKLISVLEHLGDDSYRRRKFSSILATEDVDILSGENKDILNTFCDKICSVIKEKSPIVVRELIQKAGGYDQDALIMRAIKYLGDQEIITRDDQKRIQPGKNWKY